MKLYNIYKEYGVTPSAHQRRQQLLSKTLGYENMKDVRSSLKTKRLSLVVLKETINQLPLTKKGRPTLLLPDEEALLVANMEMSAATGMTRSIKSLGQMVTEIINQSNLSNGKQLSTATSRYQNQRALLVEKD